MRLVLVRHGETEHNRGGLTLGRADVPLTDRGRWQARAVASAIGRPPAAIYTSPLQRASDTAGEIGAHTGVGPVIDDKLIEMDVGEMEHYTPAELRERYPEFLELWMSDGCGDARMPGGETLAEVQARAWDFVERAERAHADATVVAVTHNFVILTLVCRAVGLPLAGFRRMRPALGSISIVEAGPAAARLLRFNDVAHLAAAGLTDDPIDGGAR